jgi:hypothetical protein
MPPSAPMPPAVPTTPTRDLTLRFRHADFVFQALGDTDGYEGIYLEGQADPAVHAAVLLRASGSLKSAITACRQVALAYLTASRASGSFVIRISAQPNRLLAPKTGIFMLDDVDVHEVRCGIQP